jgi:hypothetical protein
MKAVVWRGDRTLEIETVEDARIEAPTDKELPLAWAVIMMSATISSCAI